MEVSMRALALAYGIALLLGAGLGLFCNAIRITRLMLGSPLPPRMPARLRACLSAHAPHRPARRKTHRGNGRGVRFFHGFGRFGRAAFVFLGDLLFFAVAGCAVAVYAYACLDGALRLYSLLFVVLGFVAWSITIGRPIMAASERILWAVRSACLTAGAAVCLPFLWIAPHFCRAFCVIFRKIHLIFLYFHAILYIRIYHMVWIRNGVRLAARGPSAPKEAVLRQGKGKQNHTEQGFGRQARVAGH